MADKQKPDPEQEMVIRHATQLAEHFDSVQIFVNRDSDDKESSYSIDFGVGNVFARCGQARDWVDRALRVNGEDE